MKKFQKLMLWYGSGIRNHTMLKIFRMIRMTVFLILLGISQVFALESYSQATKITLKMSNTEFNKVLKEIEKKSEFFFIYNRDLIDVEQKVELNMENKSIYEILDVLLAGKDINYYISDRQIVLSKLTAQSAVSGAFNASQQQVSVTGTVTDVNNSPLPGVTVIVKGTTNGTVTDNNGNFTLSNVSANSVLVYSFVGMRSQEVELNGRSTVNVTLEEETFGIEEVVAIGYGTQKKRDIIGSISTITTDELTRAASTGSFDAAMQGLAPGLMVSSESGIPGAPVQIKVRGISSISSGTDPLWIVDGIPIVSQSMGSDFDGESSQNVMSLINPTDIESIQVLKDAAATSIYGSRGSNGVILVTTKSGKKGVMTLNVDLKSGVSNWANRDIGLANNTEFIEIMDRAYANSGTPGNFDPQTSLNQLDGVMAGISREEALSTNTDWGDVISRTGTFVEANVSATQGSEKGNSYMSLRYRKDNSILKYSDLELFSANANLNYNLLDVLDINYRGFVSYSNNNRAKSDYGRAGAGGWAQVNAYSLPWMKIYDETDTGINGFWNPLSGANALAGISPLNTESNLQTLNVLQGLNGTLNLAKGLTLRGEFGA